MGDVPDGQGLNYGLLMAAEWAAKEGKGKIISASLVDRAFNEAAQGDYIVPAGKTWTMKFIIGVATANLAVDGDKKQCFDMFVLKNLTSQFLIAGDTGVTATFSVPRVFDALDNVSIVIRSKANHPVDLSAWAFCYEEDA